MQKIIVRAFVLVSLSLVIVAHAQRGAATRPRSPSLTADDNWGTRRGEIGRLFIRNYSPKEYGAHPQNWAIVQDQRGVMYFGNGLGVLEYDAVSWRLITLPNKSVVRSLDLDENGRIYVGAQGEFGYLAPDAVGQMQYVSMLDLLLPADREFTDVWRTFATPTGIYFQTPTHLFRYRPSLSGAPGLPGKMQVWRPRTRFNRAALARGRFYIPQVKIGLMEMVGDSLRLLPATEKFADEIYPVILPYFDGTEQAGDEKVLIATATGGLFLYDGKAALPFPTAAEQFVRASEIYRGTLLQDGRYALATRLGGVAIFDRQGHVQIIDRDAGLRVNKVYYVFPDKFGAMWLGLENGISRIETASPLSLFDELSGLKSTVYGIIRHQGKLYVSTNTGVFYLKPPSAAPGKRVEFQLVAGIAEQSWSLLSFNNSLLVATGDGVYRIAVDRADFVKSSVGESYVSLALARSRKIEKRVYVGLTDGLASLLYEPASGQWRDEGRVPGIYEQIWSLVETPQGDLWLGTDAQGVLRIRFREMKNGSESRSTSQATSLEASTIDRFGVADGLAEGGVQVFAAAGKEFFATTSGVFRFDPQHNVFFRDTTFDGVGFGNTQEEYTLKEDVNGNVWINFGRESALAVRRPDGTFEVEKRPFLRFAESPAIVIYPDNEGVVWFGGADGLVRYDRTVEKNYAQDYAALIRRVLVAEDSVIFAGTATPAPDHHYADARNSSALPEGRRGANPTLPYSGNAVRFEFCAAFFEAEAVNQFQSFLEGFDDHWSAWSKEAQKHYTNLPHGDYRFRVRAMNIYQHLSAEAEFAFTILPPWYRTWWAYLSYFGILAALIFGLVRVRTRQLHQRSRELEKTVQERTREIRRQAAAIKSQSDELEEKNREIVKTQEQLIVQEKLASLGQLTAGIAHEIKNPLNFVNNFAKLSVELIVELQQTLARQREKLDPATQEDLQEVLQLLSQNITKIDEHGRRADSIVKGMLLHSRGESGERRPADLNAILDEYVMLAYHGMRGVDSTFNIKIEKDYDTSIAQVEVFPQDLSRVFLNLVNNACYATHQKKKRLGEGYTPVLTVRTRDLGDSVEIRIRDNGTGIPQNVHNRIFHPFFTTKPSGHGTGLGLSISYDIVVHEHKGEIHMETEEGEFTEFVIRLPRTG
jgi:signal transduction histidine kinase/ligand-binding sensor domain-containing protein